MRFSDRPAADLIVFALTGLVCLVVIGILLAAVVLQTQGKDVGESINWVSRIVNTMVGGIFGYLAGRTVTRNGGGGR